MKFSLHKILLFICLFSAVLYEQDVKAQAPTAACTGTTRAAINWDLQYMPSATAMFLPSGTKYSFGTTDMQLSWAAAPSNTITFDGIVGEHTAETGTFGEGNDIKFTLAGATVTLNFGENVSNVQFTIHDVDQRQTVVVSGRNAANVAQTINMSRPGGGTTGITNNNTAAATFSTGNTTYANNVTTGSVNVTVAGPVKTVTMTFTKSNTTGDAIYISDIHGCVTNDWPTNYQAISTPEAGQPEYMLASYDSTVYVVDKTNNIAEKLFAIDTLVVMNSLAYDPYNQVVYYCSSRLATWNRQVFKYDVRTGVKSVFINDVNTLGIQTFERGVASGAAAFYNGSLFLGVEGNSASNSTTNQPSAIWRIDINASGIATSASRFWSTPTFIQRTATSYRRSFDWADFVINNGILYNFNSTDTMAVQQIQHLNLNTQTVTAGYNYMAIINGLQASIDYQGNVYDMEAGSYAVYNGAGGFGAATGYIGTPALPLVISDGAEAFKFPADYGDAPVSYGVAAHRFKVSPDLYIGGQVDYEMTANSNALATADDDNITDSGNDEEGVSAFGPLTTANASYSINVSVTNTTGATAYMYAYIDFNGDGDFTDANERSLLTPVPNGATSVVVTWVGLSGLVEGDTYVRIRLAANQTEIATATSMARTGEVEDYPITITASSLPVELTHFDVKAQENQTALLTWATASEFNNNYFEIQRSEDAINWSFVGIKEGIGNSRQINYYDYVDAQPAAGINYYRLKQVDFDGKYEYLPIKSVRFNSQEESTADSYTFYPNPTNGMLHIKASGNISSADPVRVEVFNVSGEILRSDYMDSNEYTVDLGGYANGMYFVRIDNKVYNVIKN